jgi:hypothetical protein
VNLTGGVTGERLGEKVVWQMLRRYAAEVGVPGIRPGLAARLLQAVLFDGAFFGSRKMAVELGVGRHRARRLMRILGIEAHYPKPHLSRPAPGHQIYPYLLRGVAIERPNQVWSTDITYIPMSRGLRPARPAARSPAIPSDSHCLSQRLTLCRLAFSWRATEPCVSPLANKRAACLRLFARPTKSRNCFLCTAMAQHDTILFPCHCIMRDSKIPALSRQSGLGYDSPGRRLLGRHHGMPENSRLRRPYAYTDGDAQAPAR